MRPVASSASAQSQKRVQHERMPSTTGYMLIAGVAAGGLFIVLWWMLHSGGDDTPWVPAALAAGVVMFVAAAAREVVMRRAWTRYLLEQNRRDHHSTNETWKRAGSSSSASGSVGGRVSRHSAALRSIQKQAAEADAAGAHQPEAHLEVYQGCKDFLASSEEALRSAGMDTEKSVALRSGQERARALQKHHLLAWARGASQLITTEAQRRVLNSDKIETAMRAIDVIESARKIYPEDKSLLESEAAVRAYIVSVKIGRWIELAERAAFKGHYRRAIDRYRDALFYLSRETMGEESRAEVAERIGREIELLRARLKTGNLAAKMNPNASHQNPRPPHAQSKKGNFDDQPAMSEMP
jgi:hypothetical protein